MNAILEIGLNNALMAVVLAMVAVAAGTMRKSHPALTHALWLLVFVKLLTPPLIAVPVSVLSEPLDGLVVQPDPSEAAQPGRTHGNAAVPSDPDGSWVDDQYDSGAFDRLNTQSASNPGDSIGGVTLGPDQREATSHSVTAGRASSVRGIVIGVLRRYASS